MSCCVDRDLWPRVRRVRSRSGLRSQLFFYETHKLGDILRRRIRRDAMAEIEDVRAILERLAHTAHALRKEVPTSHHQLWIEIALQRHPVRRLLLRERGRSSSIHTKRSDAGLAGIAAEMRAAASGKADHGHSHTE